jgi:hypothetical protein
MGPVTTGPMPPLALGSQDGCLLAVPPPMSYMNEFAELVDAPALSFQQQNHLLADLRGYLDHDEGAITSIISLVMAASAIKEIDVNPGAYGNRQTITMARVIAIIGIVAVVFLFILYLQIPSS